MRGRSKRCSPNMSCRERHGMIRWHTCKPIGGLAGPSARARELLAIEPDKTFLVVEHEYPPARIQDRQRLKPILKGSIAFTRAIDEAAAAMHALQSEVLAAQGMSVQGVGRQAYRS